MTVEVALLTYLKSVSALVAVVEDKIYFLQADQKVSPDYVVFYKIAGARLNALPFASPLIQISYFSENEWKAVDGAKIIIDAIRGYSGNMGTLFVGQGIYMNDRVFKQGDVYHAPVDIRLSFMEA